MFWKKEEKQVVNQQQNQPVEQINTVEEKETMKLKENEVEMIDVSFKISSDDYKIYKILFDKIKAENPKIQDEELNRILFLKLIIPRVATLMNHGKTSTVHRR